MNDRTFVLLLAGKPRPKKRSSLPLTFGLPICVEKGVFLLPTPLLYRVRGIRANPHLDAGHPRSSFQGLGQPFARDRRNPLRQMELRQAANSPSLLPDGEPRIVGRTGEHLSFSLTHGRTRRRALAFGLAELGAGFTRGIGQAHPGHFG